jgi:hypothetical protein
MTLVIQIALGVLLGWILIQGVQGILNIPQKRMDRAKAKMDALIAEAVENGDTKQLQIYEAESRKMEMGGYKGYKPDLEAAMREAEKRKR